MGGHDNQKEQSRKEDSVDSFRKSVCSNWHTNKNETQKYESLIFDSHNFPL